MTSHSRRPHESTTWRSVLIFAMLAASQMVDGRNIGTDDDPGRPNITSNKLSESDNSRQWTPAKGTHGDQ